MRKHLLDTRDIFGPQLWYDRPVQWCMELLDGTFLTSLEMDWNDIATMQPVALAPGVVGTLPFTKSIRSLYLHSTILSDCTMWMPAPSEEGTPFFGFARYAMACHTLPAEITGHPVDAESQWRYTVFGYIFEDTRTMCLVTDNYLSLGTELSSDPFSL